MFRLLRFTGGFTATNAYLLIQPDGPAILVDAPDEVASWPELENVQLGALLITHGHFDHVIGAAEVARRFGCPIQAFARHSPSLTLEAMLAFSGYTAHVPPYEVADLLTESSQLTFGNLNLRVIHVPGHSPDSLCYSVEQPDARGKRVVFGGDVLFKGSIGRTDFPHSDHSLFLRGIRDKLYTMPEETVVYPGHGPPTSIGEEKSFNPFVRAEPSAD